MLASGRVAAAPAPRPSQPKPTQKRAKPKAQASPSTNRAPVVSRQKAKTPSRTTAKPHVSKPAQRKPQTRKPETKRPVRNVPARQVPTPARRAPSPGVTKQRNTQLPSTRKPSVQRAVSLRRKVPPLTRVNVRRRVVPPNTRPTLQGSKRQAPVHSQDTLSPLLAGLYILLLAMFVGFALLSKVPPILHAPMISGINVISAITLMGALYSARYATTTTSSIFGMVAVGLAVANLVGGWILTDRMLQSLQR
ncbi:MAG: hypothetical protein EP343_10625 [Deltaproteobacteria bacterium]|nr:MAG: hypothetical protein EP343_10625 [Deltaproteobacteria bacterium]